MADEEMESAPADNAAGLATGMIVITTIVLIAAVLILNGIAKDHYSQGLF